MTTRLNNFVPKSFSGRSPRFSDFLISFFVAEFRLAFPDSFGAGKKKIWDETKERIREREGGGEKVETILARNGAKSPIGSQRPQREVWEGRGEGWRGSRKDFAAKKR